MASPRARLHTAQIRRHNYSKVDNIIMRVRLNAIKNEAKAKELSADKQRHIILQTTSNAGNRDKDEIINRIKQMYGQTERVKTVQAMVEK